MKHEVAPGALIELPVHARTGLRAIGVLPSGRIVWPQLGGSGDDDDASTDTGTDDGGNAGDGSNAGSGNSGDDDTGGAGSDANTDTNDDTDDDGNAGDDGDGDGDGDGDDGDGGDSGRDDNRQRRDQAKTARTIANLRADFKGERAKRQAAEKKAQEFEQQASTFQQQLDKLAEAQKTRTDGLAKLLGFKKDDAPPDPEQIAKELNDKLAEAEAKADAERVKTENHQSAQRAAEVKLAVYTSADDHEADPKALLDSASFLRKVTGLDPEADDFADQVSEAIKTAVEGNPRLRKSAPKTARGKSGTEHTPQPTRKRPSSLTEAVGNAYRR